MCRWLGALLTPPVECFCPPEGQKLLKHDKNQLGLDTNYLSVCTESEASIPFFKAMYADK